MFAVYLAKKIASAILSFLLQALSFSLRKGECRVNRVARERHSHRKRECDKIRDKWHRTAGQRHKGTRFAFAGRRLPFFIIDWQMA